MRTMTIDNFPTWALSAVVNDDRSSLTEEDETILDTWLSEMKDKNRASWMDICPIYDREGNFEEHFSAYPRFGLATNVCEVHVILQ